MVSVYTCHQSKYSFYDDLLTECSGENQERDGKVMLVMCLHAIRSFRFLFYIYHLQTT